MDVSTLEKKLLQIVSKSAPVLGSVLGGPMAGVAVSLISNLFGVSDQKTDSLLEAISSDPEAGIKLKTLEYSHIETLSQIASHDYSTEVDDRKSARERENIFTNLGKNDFIPPILSVSFLIVYAIVQAYAITNPSTPVDMISARVQDIMVMIVSYYFGSSNTKKTM